MPKPQIIPKGRLHLGSLPHDHLRATCEDYIQQRTSTFTQRCPRFDAAIDLMLTMGLQSGDIIYDIGGGAGDLRTRLQQRDLPNLVYVNIDGRFGTNLEKWNPDNDFQVYGHPHFMVALEVFEHLTKAGWQRLSEIMRRRSRVGAVCTTPNPRMVDVMGMDHTHISPIHAPTLRALGWHVRECMLFGKAADTLLGWHKRITLPGLRAA